MIATQMVLPKLVWGGGAEGDGGAGPALPLRLASLGTSPNKFGEDR